MVAIHGVGSGVGSGVGESPVWDDGVLRWVDIPAGAVFAMTPDGAVSGIDVGDLACFLSLHRGGGAVFGLHRQLAYLDFDTGATTTFLDPEPDRRQNRFNNAGVDPAGRLWFSTMQNNITDDGGETPVTEATGALLYFGDTMANRIRRYELDADGEICDAADLHGPPPPGGCDGSALDAQGYLWNTRFGLSDAALAENPNEGGVVALDVGVAGRPANRFAG